MSNVVELPQQESITSVVSAEARAELARRKATIRMLANFTGRPYSQWQARMAGTVSMDLEDLAQLGEFLGIEPRELLPALRRDGGPEWWAPSGSNRRPTD